MKKRYSKSRESRVRLALIGNTVMRTIEIDPVEGDSHPQNIVEVTHIKAQVPRTESVTVTEKLETSYGVYSIDHVSVKRVMAKVPRDRVHRRF